jgi:hypothetical protein
VALLCRHQSEEFLLRSQAGIPAQEILAAATTNCAELFMKQVRQGAGQLPFSQPVSHAVVHE